MSILELFSRRDVALTFTQVAERLRYPRSSLHGLLRTLTVRGWLRHDAETRCFSLGLRAWEAGNAYTPAVELARHAAPVLDRLEASFDGGVNVAVLDGADTVSVASTAGDAGLRAAAHTSGAGRVLLADLDHAARERRLGGAAGQSAESIDALHSALDQVRAQGWGDLAADRNGSGLGTLAVPVRGSGGGVVAALEVAAPVERLAAERRDETLRELRRGAEQIAAGLGG